MHEHFEHLKKKCLIERFCGCTTLRIGCYVIGGIGWILTLIKIYLIASRTTVSDNSTITYYDIEYKVCYIMITLITSAALIWGAYKLKRWLILPWLILRCFESILMILVTIIFFAMIFHADDYLLLAITTFLIFLIGTGVSWYFWICVYNFYKNLNPNTIEPDVGNDVIEKNSHVP